MVFVLGKRDKKKELKKKRQTSQPAQSTQQSQQSQSSQPAQSIRNKRLCNVAKGALPYICIAVVLFVVALVLDQWWIYQQPRESVAKVFFTIFACLGVGFVVLAFLTYKKKVSMSVLIFYVMFVGLVMRIVYVCYSSVYDRQYDVWYIKKPGDKPNFYLYHGHLQYIYNLFSRGELPVTNQYQFYHPPLWHMLSAVVLKVFTGLGYSLDYAIECIQLLGTFCSEAILVIFYRLLKTLDIRPKFRFAAMVVASISPIFVIMGATINNDIMMTMFFMATLLYLIRWWKTGGTLNIVLMGVFLGLGMMTKTSAVLIAPVIAIAFGVRFVQALVLRRKETAEYKKAGEQAAEEQAAVEKQELEGKQIPYATVSTYIKQFVLFALTSIPLGIWYQIRNKVLFDQALNYVMRFKESSALYCGDTRFLMRLFSFPKKEFVSKLFCSSSEDHSILPYLLKTSIFEEHSYDSIISVGWLLFYIACLLATTATICMFIILLRDFIYKLKKNSKMGCEDANSISDRAESSASLGTFSRILSRIGTKGKWLMFYTWFMLFFGYLIFCLKYPFACTMDARYISASFLISLVFMAMGNEHVERRNTTLGTVMCQALNVVAIVFAIAVVVFYVSMR